MRRTVWRGLLAVLVLAAAGAALVAWLNLRGESPVSDQRPASLDAAAVARGAYLARAGNCVGCHTERGGVGYAGGRRMDTPFGALYAPNLTPDAQTGLGSWSPSEFWRALHHGRGRDGRLLYPAFPYPSYTQVTREDSDALWAYLQSLPPVRRANTPHVLRFPYNQQAALAVWRALYFRAEDFQPDPNRSAEWNRGAYLVRGLGHCVACHAARNVLGASRGGFELGGGLIPMENWYAPSLAAAGETSVAAWPAADVVALLQTGVAPHGMATGPMAEVVYRSTQYLSEPDLKAMAGYLQALPQLPPAQARAPAAEPAVLRQGEQLYGQHCAKCHGEQGQGVAGIYPPLAGNRAVTLPASVNLVKSVLHGGFAPATAGNPRPYGMPPFAQQLNDAELAALLSYLRQAWGHQAAAVSLLDVQRAR
ncbi:MAG TPA: cytochrome c [Ideonella sp.]|uniref:cytochrome c n=1 Tax=Ideonella sp. TaxID=1929293 RepID=UPI002CB19D91|nr:cytochrome c [Ideonella sp.]HSI50298.1 cytochrome c [Ideonella sp.]